MNRHPLTLKLSSFIDFTPAELHQIEEWSSNRIHVAARKTLVRQGDRPGPSYLILKGWAYRHKDLRSGKRQILGILMPGDMSDLNASLLGKADHGITMASNAIVAQINADDLAAGLVAHPRLMQALWWSTLVDEGTTREWLANIGLRGATARVAHLFCELWMRADRVDLISERDSTLPLPLSQSILAEALGLTGVHVNRVLRVLREEGLVTFQRKQLVISDLKRLKSYADFDPTYLQLERR